MASGRFFGKIGFVESVHDEDLGTVVEKPHERDYFGSIQKDYAKQVPTENLNDNLGLGNTFSIVGDPYLVEHIYAMKYVVWQGVRWAVRSVEVRTPRLIISVGGVYNGPEVGPSEDSSNHSGG